LNIRWFVAPVLTLVAASCGLPPEPNSISGTAKDGVRTFQIEMRKGDEVLARVELQVASGKKASYERSWPLVADQFCEAKRIDLPIDIRRASEGQTIRVQLQPLRRDHAEGSAPQMMEVYASWRENFGMPGGLETASCRSFPTTVNSTSFRRTVMMDLQHAVTLRGDRELYLTVVPK